MANQEALIIKDSGGTEADVTASNALKVDGSAVTQPVSGTVTVTPSGTQDVNIVSTISIPVTGTFFQATQPVSSASLPLPTGAAIAANQQTDALTDTQLRATPVPVSGTVAITSGTLATEVTVAAIEADTTLLAGTVSASRINTNAAITSIAAGTNNIGDVDVASIAAGTNYIGKVRLTDGTTDGEVVPLAGYNAQAVAIVDGSGAQITSFGGGVQYTEGDVDATVTGTAVMWEDTADTMRVASASKPLPVAIDGQVSGFESTLNSTYANLAIGASFTGTYEDISNYSSVTLTVYASVASGTNGIEVFWSHDGVNLINKQLFTHLISVSTYQTLVLARLAKYFRIKYTNGGSLASPFYLQSVFNKYASNPSNERPMDAESNEQAMGNISAHLSAYNGTTWDRLRGNIKYGLGVDPANNLGTLFRGQSATFRTLGRAGTVGQKLMALHNATGSSITLQVKSISVDMWQTVVKAITVAPPIVRIWKFTAVPTNGTNLTKNKVGGTTTSSASATLWGDASADGTGSATTLTVTLPAGTILDSKVPSRIITAAGDVNTKSIEFKWEDGIELAPLEGICVFLDYTLATQNPVTDMWVASINWKEYTT